MGDEEDTPDLIVMLRIIQNCIDTTHMLLKYVVETHKEGKSLDYAMPVLEMHIKGMDKLSGPADLKTSIDFVKESIDHLKEVH